MQPIAMKVGDLAKQTGVSVRILHRRLGCYTNKIYITSQFGELDRQ
jgi:hypothetical protein